MDIGSLISIQLLLQWSPIPSVARLCANCQDVFGGVYDRWHILFNFNSLRLISFNMDYYWSCTKTTTLEVRIPFFRLWVPRSDLTTEERGRRDVSFRTRQNRV